jgi:hypothetical protein
LPKSFAVKRTLSETSSQIRSLITDTGDALQGVCFDYFDTLVSRTVAPEYTKVIAAEHLSVLLGLQLSGRALYEIRREVEAVLCRKNVEMGGDAEFNLCDLAADLYAILQTIGGMQGIFEKEEVFVDSFIALELAVEAQTQKISDELLHLVTWLKEKKIKVYLISDFYIPGRYFSRMLAQHGLADVFSEIFVSTDYKRTKSSGKLYQRVLAAIGCRPAELVMIGDNEHSDRKIPEGLGIRAFLIDTAEQKILYSTWQNLYSSQSQRKVVIEKEFTRLAATGTGAFFPEMASTLWLFTTKLFRRLLDARARTVFFCSKEGEFLKKLFITFQEIVYGRQIIEAEYLLVSRKATFICSLKTLAEEDFHRLFDQYRDLSIEEFLLSLNFSISDVETICSGLNFDRKVRHFDLKSRPEFESLVGHAVFRDYYERHRREQKNHFRRYLDAFDLDVKRDGLFLVDVGWKGSIQNNIFHALDGLIEVSGYYIGLLSPTDLYPKNRKEGLVFSDFPGHTPYVHVYNNNRSLFEMLLGATHGSADGYFSPEEFGRVQKIRNSSLYTTVHVKGESTGVTVLDLPAERELYQQHIQPLQAAISEQFVNFSKLYVGSGDVSPEPEWFARQHARMVFHPSVDEIDFYANLYHLENFGLFEFTRFAAETSPHLLQRIKNLAELLKNKEAILETGVWPPIIFRKQGLLFLQRIDGLKRHRRCFQEGGAQ